MHPSWSLPARWPYLAAASLAHKWTRRIPVEWRDPKKADFDRFSETMREHQDDHVLVQCAANYRASAMTYLYRVVVEKVREDEAAEDLHAVWDPNDNATWREYINDIKMAGHM